MADDVVVSRYLAILQSDWPIAHIATHPCTFLDDISSRTMTSDDEVAALKSRIAQLERDLQRAIGASSSVGGGIGSSTGDHSDGNDAAAPTSTSSLVSKSGYLFKWQDRSIGWGGTKWGLRFVSLNGGRLSYYRSHTDQMARYVLNLRRCAVRDDGYKLNRKHKSSGGGSSSSSSSGGDSPNPNEVGAYYHVFSIYQRPERREDGKGPASPCADDDDDSRIVPLLRFSTPSLAEKNQWIDLISEACAWADSEESMLVGKDQGISACAPSTPTRDPPVARPGTLPPLIFGAPAYPKPRRTPSGTKLSPMGAKKKSYTKIAASADSARSNRRNVAAYPPSKPMHRKAEPSFLSDEAPSQNFRGLLNLALIVLVVSNFRLILDTVQRHGFVLANAKGSSINLEEWRHAPLTVSPFLSGAALLILSTFFACVIEMLLSRKYVKEWLGMGLHLVNTNILALLVPAWIVWTHIDSPAVGAFLLIHATITWMKQISYFHANSDYRASPESHTATLALLKDLDAGSAEIAYPFNVTLSNIFYFWLAPTLTYQIVFPRSPRIRLAKIAGIVFRLAVAISFLLFLVAQVISPNLDNLLKELETSGDAVFSWHIFGDYLLKLSIANTYVWLLVFYIYFHLYLNLFAEILRFGDRVFYRDWWNASNVSSYWRLWNMPVHFWLVRHVYFPCYRLGMSKTVATFVVFFVSAILHEVLVSIPFHMVRHWSFLGMLGQLPLVAITKHLDRVKPGSSIGNVIFWIVFCVVGQPMAVLMYTIDYWKASRAEVCNA
jgi:diacylglycerol O-acyltransferase-1